MRRLWLAAGAGLLMGCAPMGGGEPGAAVLAASLEVELAGDTVWLTLHATNTSGIALRLEYPSAQRYDFEVRDSGGRVVWRWSEGRMFAQVQGEEALPAGSTVRYRAAWPAPGPGWYTAVGQVLSSNHPLELHADFRVENE